MKIALVNYLNTTPFVLGLQAAFSAQEMQMLPLPPSQCAKALASGEAQMALVPIGALPELGAVHLLEDHCIGANEVVDSVFVLSHVPMHQITHLVQDAESRTSNALAAILMQHHWQQPAQLLPPSATPFESAAGTTAVVGIGDKARAARGQFAHSWDLATEWKSFTGLPMVFAVWAYRPDAVAPAMLHRVDEALHKGRTRLRQAAEAYAALYGHTPDSALDYLTRCIDLRFTAERHQALDLYLRLLPTVQVPLL